MAKTINVSSQNDPFDGSTRTYIADPLVLVQAGQSMSKHDLAIAPLVVVSSQSQRAFVLVALVGFGGSGGMGPDRELLKGDLTFLADGNRLDLTVTDSWCAREWTPNGWRESNGPAATLLPKRVVEVWAYKVQLYTQMFHMSIGEIRAFEIPPKDLDALKNASAIAIRLATPGLQGDIELTPNAALFFAAMLRGVCDPSTPPTYSPVQAPGCFPADTPILTPSGYRPIIDLQRGDRVISVTSSFSRVEERVMRKLAYAPSEVLSLGLEGRCLPVRTTARHTFLTSKGWRQAGLVRPGDEIVAVDPRGGFVDAVVVSTCRQLAEPVFNLHTSGPHSFIADGLVAHNFTHLRQIRTQIHRLLFDHFFPAISTNQRHFKF